MAEIKLEINTDKVLNAFDEPFHSMYGDIMYPGDPKADSRDVWRCRCSVGVRMKGASAGQRRVNSKTGEVISYKSYLEWEREQNG